MARPAATRSKSRFIARTIKGAKPVGTMPSFIPPMLATPQTKVPKGDGWLFELKFDGWRVQGHLLRGGAKITPKTLLKSALSNWGWRKG